MQLQSSRTPAYRISRRRNLIAGAIALLAPAFLGMASAQKPPDVKSEVPAAKRAWRPISQGVLDRLTAEGKKIAWPGGTAGVSVDRVTGKVRMIVPDQGLWTSSDRGVTFARVDGGNVSGRCETGFALNADPAGRRLACFMLDGRSALTCDDGKTWTPFQQHGRGWDFGVVDWSQATPHAILAIHHESGGELHLSEDGGTSWKLLGKDFTAIGIFSARVFVASKGNGILRSVDGGANWTKVSDRTPTGRTLCVFKGVGCWTTREGLLVSKDSGITWTSQGSSLEAAWGPFFVRTRSRSPLSARRARRSASG